MLGQRIITAIALVVVLLCVVFFSNELFFALFVSLVSALAVWEWSRLAAIQNTVRRCLFCLLLILACSAGYFFLQNNLLAVLIFSLGFWLLAFLFIYSYPRGSQFWNNTLALSIAGFLVLFPCWYLLIYLRSQADFAFNFLGLIALVAAADSGAYFSGKAFGKHKLAESVSPNKTWEGVGGGVLACFIVMLLIGFTANSLQIPPYHWSAYLVLPLLISFFSVTGDLLESMLKRAQGMKDSGNILPGHGGILDRIDGIVASVPVFILTLEYMV